MILNNLNFAVNINIEAKTNAQANIKKILKKKLSLDYTNPKFETQLDEAQKQAILKSLKKWKNDLPVDNIFTVTSIANLKSETLDDTKQHKKQNKNTSNALVVYMWSQTPNEDYDPKNPEDSEEGDSKFIRTQFNVLLKQSKNGNWKASLERDPETKIEVSDITETDEDVQIYKDLFITDNTDSAFTAAEEVLIEDANTIPAISKSPPPNPVISSTPDIPEIILPRSSVHSQPKPVVTPTQNELFAVTKEKTGWLQNILNFGNITASASSTEYSWPWKNGDKWKVVTGWHECGALGTLNTNFNNPNFLGCALDVAPSGPDTITGYITAPTLYAPITTTISRSCDDGYQGAITMGDMLIQHIDKNSMNANTNGAFVRKGSVIGNMFSPNFELISIHMDYNYTPTRWVSPCGGAILAPYSHIHIKLKNKINIPADRPKISVENMKYETLYGSFNIDGFNLQGPKLLPLRADGMQNYNAVISGNNVSFTELVSQNTSNTNIYTGKVRAFTNSNQIFDIKDFNGGNNAPVIINISNTGGNAENQLWSYDDVNKQIKGMNGKCLDVGVTTNTPDRGLKMQDCSSSANQKWSFNYNNQIVSNAISANCIEALNGVVNNSILVINPCNVSNNNQKWNFSEIANLAPRTWLNVRVNLSGAWNNTTKLMNTSLNTAAVIPLNQPFCTIPWNYCGNENIPNRSNMDQTAVDWVLIEIKNSSGATIQRKAALITKDAYLTAASGINAPGQFYPVSFDSIATSGSYKVIVRHRNHLAIASDANITIAPSYTRTDIDFTKNVNVKSVNQSLLGTINNVNVYGLRFGDVNSDGLNNSTDRNIISNASEMSIGYSKIDINLDSMIDATDRMKGYNMDEAQEVL